ncbi:hypothetical protein ACFLS5_01125 [Candidatus Bipolaricaulota bacterium]
MDGCFGKYADVNLSTGEIADYRIPEMWLEKHSPHNKRSVAEATTLAAPLASRRRR